MSIGIVTGGIGWIVGALRPATAGQLRRAAQDQRRGTSALNPPPVGFTEVGA